MNLAVRVDTALWMWSLYAGSRGQTGRAKNQTKREFCSLTSFALQSLTSGDKHRDVHWGLHALLYSSVNTQCVRSIRQFYEISCSKYILKNGSLLAFLLLLLWEFPVERYICHLTDQPSWSQQPVSPPLQEVSPLHQQIPPLIPNPQSSYTKIHSRCFKIFLTFQTNHNSSLESGQFHCSVFFSVSPDRVEEVEL